MLKAEGYTMPDLVSLSEQRISGHVYDISECHLWPKGLWRIMQGIPMESEDNDTDEGGDAAEDKEEGDEDCAEEEESEN
jgi:hypothetical protein